MGPIDFSDLLYLGIVIGIIICIAVVGLCFGAWWLLGHIQWVP